MSILSIASGIVAIAKAIPAVERIIQQVVDLFTEYKIGQIQGRLAERSAKRKALMTAIIGAESNEDRKALSIMLADLNRSELSNADSSTDK